MKNVLIIIFSFLFLQCYAQKCTHTNLSKKYDYTTTIKRKVVNERECEIIVLSISNKLTKVEQIILLNSDGLCKGDLLNCNSVRSYITNINYKVVAKENDFGDFIIADLNFDGKEDIALKAESVGNGGPIYKFYLQNNKGNFIEDKYLSDTVLFFPFLIDVRSKKLITDVRANTYQKCKTSYQLDVKSNKWKIIKKLIY